MFIVNNLFSTWIYFIRRAFDSKIEYYLERGCVFIFEYITWLRHRPSLSQEFATLKALIKFIPKENNNLYSAGKITVIIIHYTSFNYLIIDKITLKYIFIYFQIEGLRS